MTLGDGQSIALAAESPTTLTTSLTLVDDNSYRVALADRDGMSNRGDTEYFIRMLDDRPPDVHILKPAADRSVTRLEEVDIEAQADDDYGIERHGSRVCGPRAAEKVVPLCRSRARATSATGRHTLYLEDLNVQPGDFVSYYVRARDVTRGKRSNETKSDIFFLEVQAVRAGVRARAEPGDVGRRRQLDRRSRRRRRRRSSSRRGSSIGARESAQGRAVGAGHPFGLARRGGAEDARRADLEQLPRVDDARSAAAAASSARRAPGADAARGRRDDGGRRRRWAARSRRSTR